MAAGRAAVRHAHANTWKVNGRPDVDQFTARFTERTGDAADEPVELHGLGRRLFRSRDWLREPGGSAATTSATARP